MSAGNGGSDDERQSDKAVFLRLLRRRFSDAVDHLGGNDMAPRPFALIAFLRREFGWELDEWEPWEIAF